jgi:hypothetical protein
MRRLAWWIGLLAIAAGVFWLAYLEPRQAADEVRQIEVKPAGQPAEPADPGNSTTD